jgi:hypothetical protein
MELHFERGMIIRSSRKIKRYKTDVSTTRAFRSISTSPLRAPLRIASIRRSANRCNTSTLRTDTIIRHPVIAGSRISVADRVGSDCWSLGFLTGLKYVMSLLSLRVVDVVLYKK